MFGFNSKVVGRPGKMLRRKATDLYFVAIALLEVWLTG